MLKLVADTNTVVSALLWHGAPHRLFQAIETEEISFYASRALVAELADVLGRRKLARAVKASGKSVSALVTKYEELVQLAFGAKRWIPSAQPCSRERGRGRKAAGTTTIPQSVVTQLGKAQ